MSFDLAYALALGGYLPSYSRGRSKKSKSKKKKPDCWLESCTTDQLKQFCTACKVKKSGSKKELISRLQEIELADDLSERSVDYLKQKCRDKCLQVSGKKFELVLRLLQLENGTGGDTLKRAPTETQLVVDEASGETTEIQVPKKRKVIPKPDAFYNRIQKKIEAVYQKKYQTHYGSKTHAADVSSLMSELLDQVKPYVSTDPSYAIKLMFALYSSVADNFATFERPGYFDARSILDLSKEYITELLANEKQMDERLIGELAAAIGDLNTAQQGYCWDYSFSKDDEATTFKSLVELLGDAHGEYDDDDEEDDDDKASGTTSKPPAKPIVLTSITNNGPPTDLVVEDPVGSGLAADIAKGGLGVF